MLDKIQNTIREYNYLLTSQLEEQRTYFEKKLECQRKELLDQMIPQHEQLDYSIKELNIEKDKKTKIICALTKEIADYAKKTQQTFKHILKVRNDV